MFSKLFIVTTSMLFASILSAETYNCNIFIKQGTITNSDGNSSKTSLEFNTYENEPNSFTLVREKHAYTFNFIVTTSHEIVIADQLSYLSCKAKQVLMGSSKFLLTTECSSSLELSEGILTADCQEINEWKRN